MQIFGECAVLCADGKELELCVAGDFITNFALTLAIAKQVAAHSRTIKRWHLAVVEYESRSPTRLWVHVERVRLARSELIQQMHGAVPHGIPKLDPMEASFMRLGSGHGEAASRIRLVGSRPSLSSSSSHIPAVSGVGLLPVPEVGVVPGMRQPDAVPAVPVELLVPVGLVPPPTLADLIESPEGHISMPRHFAAKVVGRFSSYNNPVSGQTQFSMQCRLPGHVRCSRMYQLSTLPHDDALTEWLVAGHALPNSESHRALPRMKKSSS